MNEIICKVCGAIYTGEKEPEICICRSEEFEVLEGVAIAK